MKIRAIYATQVNGYGIVKRGEVIDLSDDRVDARIAANFRREDGSPIVPGKSGGKAKDAEKGDGDAEKDKAAAQAEAVKRTVDVVGREGIMRKLDELGVTYKPAHKTDYLARLLLEATGEI